MLARTEATKCTSEMENGVLERRLHRAGEVRVLIGPQRPAVVVREQARHAIVKVKAAIANGEEVAGWKGDAAMRCQAHDLSCFGGVRKHLVGRGGEHAAETAEGRHARWCFDQPVAVIDHVLLQR